MQFLFICIAMVPRSPDRDQKLTQTRTTFLS